MPGKTWMLLAGLGVVVAGVGAARAMQGGGQGATPSSPSLIAHPSTCNSAYSSPVPNSRWSTLGSMTRRLLRRARRYSFRITAPIAMARKDLVGRARAFRTGDGTLAAPSARCTNRSRRGVPTVCPLGVAASRSHRSGRSSHTCGRSQPARTSRPKISRGQRSSEAATKRIDTLVNDH